MLRNRIESERVVGGINATCFQKFLLRYAFFGRERLNMKVDAFAGSEGSGERAMSDEV